MIDNRKTVIFLIIVLILGAVAYLYYDYNREDVVYTPPPMETELDNGDISAPEWQLATTTEYSFRYPADIPLTYVDLVDWPPTAQITDDAFACTEAGEETARAGRTEIVTVSDREYCRTTIIEGAAGSTYTQYAHAFPVEDGTAILTFSTRSPQCGNYNEPARSDCESDQNNFDPDDLIDRIATTFSLVR